MAVFFHTMTAAEGSSVPLGYYHVKHPSLKTSFEVILGEGVVSNGTIMPTCGKTLFFCSLGKSINASGQTYFCKLNDRQKNIFPEHITLVITLKTVV